LHQLGHGREVDFKGEGVTRVAILVEPFQVLEHERLEESVDGLLLFLGVVVPGRGIEEDGDGGTLDLAGGIVRVVKRLHL